MTDAVTSGIDTAELDPATRPQDDLFRHVNGKWIDRTELPADKARYGSFHILHEEAEEAIRTIIEESQLATPGTDARKAGDLFASFMDEAAIEAKGAAPLVPLLAEVDAVDSVDALLATIGRLERAGGPGFVHLYVDNDPGDPERYLLNVVQGGLGLPDESYYREDKFAEIRTAYRAFVEELLALAGVDDAAARAERIVALEHEIAAAHWDKVESRDAQKTYNLLTWDAVAELAGAAPLAGWRDAMGLAPEHTAELIVHQPSALAGIAALVTAERLPAWRDWLAFHTVRSYASSLSDAFVQANFGFYGRTLTGTPEIRARWKRGVSLVEGVLGEAVGRVYVERHFPPAKAAMDELVADLIEAYRRSIGSLEWMGPETRRRALEKLEKFTPKIGFPVKWRDYGTLEIVADDLIANQRAAAEFEFQRELAKLGRPIDRDEWFMTPQTVNAYYNPGFNEIVFPAAILQPPFFSAERDAAANYGAIGAVIGHEIGHGFDDQGSRFDGDGRLIDWWTEADRAAFEERTGSLIAQYDALVPEQLDGDPEQHVNGALTIGENIGDLGGLGIAWQAYLVHLERQGLTEGPVIDGLTAAQRFFLSWAQAWQQKGRDEEVIRLLAIDPHSPSEFRCNQIVRNIPAFYEAFGLTEADRLWLAEPERVTIW